MSLLNMTADGDLYQASVDESDGSGFERSVEDVDDVDASGWAEMGSGTGIDNPYVTAQNIRNRDRMEAEAHQAESDNRRERSQARIAGAERHAAYGRAMNAARGEEIRLAHMGQDPLLAMAVAQQLGGADFEQQGLSGYGNTSDGGFDHDRTRGHRMGDIWGDIMSIKEEVVSTVEDVVSAKEDVMETYQSVAEAAHEVLPIPASVPVVAAPRAAPRVALSPGVKTAVKVAGISLPLLAAIGIGAYFLMKRK